MQASPAWGHATHIIDQQRRAGGPGAALLQQQLAATQLHEGHLPAMLQQQLGILHARHDGISGTSRTQAAMLRQQLGILHARHEGLACRACVMHGGLLNMLCAAVQQQGTAARSSSGE
jgi:hypothetical protein